MAVEKKQKDWLIQPTTRTVDESLKQDPPQQEVVEETAPESMEDVLANVWGVRLQGKKDAIESAAGALSGVAKEAEESRAAMERAKARQGSFLHSLLEEQRPVRKEDEEKRLRNRALVKGFGDLVSAITAGVNAYGKKGAGVVPTLASNSPLKDIEKLNAMQDEYMQRKEAWEALNLRMRMDEENAKVTDAQNAYARSLERMAAAQSNYDNAVEGYEQTMENYGKDMQDIYLEGIRQDRADRRAMLTAATRNSTKPKDTPDDPTLQNIGMLYAAQDFYGDQFAQRYLNSSTQELVGGRPIKGSVRTNTIAGLDDNDVNAIAAILSKDPKFMLYYLFPGEVSLEAIQGMTEEQAMLEIERLAGLSID